MQLQNQVILMESQAKVQNKQANPWSKQKQVNDPVTGHSEERQRRNPQAKFKQGQSGYQRLSQSNRKYRNKQSHTQNNKHDNTNT